MAFFVRLLKRFWVFLLLMNIGVLAQPGIITGYVKDATSGETLIMANVYIDGTQQGTTTNNSGYYTMPDVKPGEYTLVASYIGFLDFRKKITVAPGAALRIDIELKPAVVEGQTVTVEAEYTFEEEKQVGVLDMQPAQVRDLPAILEADLFRAIQLLPGIKASSDFSSGLYIRGGSQDQTLILLDRTTVYNPSHFFGFFSTFNPDAIKDVRIYKGGYPAEYGGRLGSVIDIFNRDGNRKEFQGRLSVGLLASRLNLEGPIPKGSVMFALRRSTLEPLLAALRNSIDDVPDAFYFYDLNGKINYDPNENNRLNFAFYAGTDNVEFPFAEDAEFNLNYGNRTFSTNWTHVFSKKLFSNFTLTASNYFSYPRFLINSTRFERDNTVSDYSVKGDFEYIPSGKFQFKTGFWAGALELAVRNRFDNEETLNETIDAKYGSAYVENQWKPSERMSVKTGLRGSYIDSGDFYRLEPRISAEYFYRMDMLFQVAYGRYYQYLTLITNEAFTGFDTWLTTDDGVPPAWGDQFVVALKTKPSETYNFDVELYYRNMRELFELDPRVQDPAGLDYNELFRFGKGYAYGAEFFLQRRKGKLNGFLGYTWGTSRRRFPEYNNDMYYPPKFDRIHDVNMVMNYQLSKKWRATVVFNYATGQAYTDVLGSYELNFPTSSNELDPFIVGGLNATRLPAYHRLDVGFTRNGKLFKLPYELQLQVINLYSRRNIWFYSYDLTENPIVREDVRMLPIIPNISFTIDF
ncbi:MAG: TonB-dependent receptor [Calditrichaeota bacterium]|nr:TonB-dependent receptor [Calditrichota bacterium]